MDFFDRLPGVFYLMFTQGFLFWCVFTALENAFPHDRGQKPLSRQSGTDAALGLLNILTMTAIIPATAWLTMAVLQPYAPHHLAARYVEAMPWFVQFAIACFAYDAIQYLRHRFTHAFLWSCHATHHSAKELRATVNLRGHPLDFAISMLVATAMLYMVGFGGAAILLANSFMAANNMWLHTNVNVGYGRLAGLFVSPNYHKWHHAIEAEGIDRNFADLFVILDKLGGTYLDPKRGMPLGYGLHGGDTHPRLRDALLYPLKRQRRTSPLK